uniref:Ribosomal protein S15 n=1 Tax=Zostera marina TaxID=29655 RepID=A0A290Y2K9_ZOSMR|nr:ribosomal protein S15 [Zostera marina]YP_010205245.1 ribosomal protein S15 [Chorda filum]ATD85276.1 ribosomal protein S15 [Zostera marina]UAV85813.1 ribosomal protein S15 [Chorda filum]
MLRKILLLFKNRDNEKKRRISQYMSFTYNNKKISLLWQFQKNVFLYQKSVFVKIFGKKKDICQQLKLFL